MSDPAIIAELNRRMQALETRLVELEDAVLQAIELVAANRGAPTDLLTPEPSCKGRLS